MIPLTRLAHQWLAPCLHPGDLAVDATAGNGHDTLFLARRVAPAGRVFAFDIQPEALESTARRLEQAGAGTPVSLFLAGHEALERTLPHAVHGRLAAVMFNLGYLPGGDHRIRTLPDTTLPALEQAARLLAPGGCLSVLAYRQHPGGLEESRQVQQFLASLSGFRLRIQESPGPVLLLASRDE